MSNAAVYRNDRVVELPTTDASAGRVRWRPAKSVWYAGMWIGWLVPGSLYFSWSAVAVFLVASAATLCLGHSLGMHRKLIHDSYQCPKWVEAVGVHLGTLVGLGGPFTMMHTHDMRDWAQRQRHCHDYFGHRRPMLQDWFWQLHCAVELDRPPAFRFPADMVSSRLYRCFEATAALQQLPWAVLLFACGGWGWVAWGICGRVAVSMTGHWLIGYFAHNPPWNGRRNWHVDGAAVQGFDVRYCGLITFGECWHNNHHAYPGSARLGLEPGQTDPGWWVLLLLGRLGLVSGLRLPKDLPGRAELVRLR